MYQLYLTLGKGLEVAVGPPADTEAELIERVRRMNAGRVSKWRIGLAQEHVDDCLCPTCLERRRQDRARAQLRLIP